MTGKTTTSLRMVSPSIMDRLEPRCAQIREANAHLKKVVVQTSVIVRVLAIAALMPPLFPATYLPQLQSASNGLMIMGAGYNAYFLFNWLRTLAEPSGRWVTVSVGVAWLVCATALWFLLAAPGLAECAAGCAAKPPGYTAWYAGLGILSIAMTFNGLLHWAHSALGDSMD